MNDIVHSSKVINFSVHADDTCLILDIEKFMYDETIRTELAKIVDWFSSDELMLNISKTDYLQSGVYLYTPDYFHPHDE